jgi:hypothetical protein
MSMRFEPPVSLHLLPLTLYTEQLIVRGTAHSRHHRVTDVLNVRSEPFLVLEDVILEEYGSTEVPLRAPFAHVNLASVLFAVSLTTVEPAQELLTPKVAERALFSIPPFRIVGHGHLPPERDLRDGLAQLPGAFIPVTDAVFWADRLGEGRQAVAYIAVNQARAQVFAPFREADPWAGVARPSSDRAQPPPAAG